MYLSQVPISLLNCVRQIFSLSLHRESPLSSPRTWHHVSTVPSWEWVQWENINSPLKKEKKKVLLRISCCFFMPIRTFCFLPHVYHSIDICPKG